MPPQEPSAGGRRSGRDRPEDPAAPGPNTRLTARQTPDKPTDRCPGQARQPRPMRPADARPGPGDQSASRTSSVSRTAAGAPVTRVAMWRLR